MTSKRREIPQTTQPPSREGTDKTTREEITKKARELTDIIFNKPDKAAQVLTDWVNGGNRQKKSTPQKKTG